MAAILKNVTNSIWHAFNALLQGSTEYVHKSKLKVLTANIGTLFDLYGVEKGLEHYRSTFELDFEQYRYYLSHEVFPQISNCFNNEDKIEEVCWLITRKKYLQRKLNIFPDASIYQLFRIFCLIGDLVSVAEGSTEFKVIMEPSETALIAEKLVNLLGLSWDAGGWDEISNNIEEFDLISFISVLEEMCYLNNIKENTPVIEAIDEIYQIFIKDIIKKGTLMKKGYLLPTFREYWFVLRPYELIYYKSASERLVCGTIALTPHCLVVPVPGTSKPQRLLLTTPERTFELATPDHKSRLQWISALLLAIEHSSGNQGYQRSEKLKRKKDKKKRENHVQEMEKTKKMLLEEVKARVAAETQVQEESIQLSKLKDAQKELERLLAEETQAKQDEEIVRALQARVLTEEWEKREELERLQEQQREMLATETLKRKQFEELQKSKEIELKEAENRLKQLESERQKLDEELRFALNRIKHSEDSKQILEEQLVIVCLDNQRDGIRRSVSFMPASNEKSLPLLQARAATLRRKKNSKVSTNECEADNIEKAQTTLDTHTPQNLPEGT